MLHQPSSPSPSPSPRLWVPNNAPAPPAASNLFLPPPHHAIAFPTSPPHPLPSRTVASFGAGDCAALTGSTGLGWDGGRCPGAGRSAELEGRYLNGAALGAASRPISQMGKLRHGGGGAVPPAALYGKLRGAGNRRPPPCERRKQKSPTARHMLRRHNPARRQRCGGTGARGRDGTPPELRGRGGTAAEGRRGRMLVAGGWRRRW